MSRVRANKLVNRAGTGAPQLTYGAEIPVGYGLTGAGDINLTGVVTATTFSGNLTGNVTGNVSGTVTGNATGLTGTPNITVGSITASSATISGNVSVAGTVTYEDVTNVDSVGIITARSGIRIGSSVSVASTLGTDGGAVFSGIVTAASFRGDGTNLTGVSAGITLRQSGTLVVGGAATTINFSGATITNVSSGIATITIAAGLGTEAATPSNAVTTLDLSKQDHKVTATGIVTVTCSGGTEGESHTVRIVNSGIATVGFSTYFLFPSGSPPSLPTTSGAISIISFTVHRVGTAGTQLLAGASLNFS